MKKLFAAVLTLSLASSAMAAGFGVEFGTNWYKVNHTNNVYDNLLGQGQNFTLTWALDNELSLGSYAEAGTWLYDNGSSDTWELTAIQVSKGIVKNVAIGTNIGRMYTTYGGHQAMLIDVFGDVTLLAGSGDKVSGAIKTQVTARYSNDAAADENFSGVSVNLLVGLLF